MPLEKFIYPPEQSSYAVTDGEEVLATKLAGGASRYRQDIINATAAVNVSWLFTPIEFEYFRAFLKGSSANRGATPFLIDLILDEALNLTEHEVYFVPGSVKTSKVQGHSISVQATLEVKPIVYPDGYFDIVAALIAQFGDPGVLTEAPLLFDTLGWLVNVHMPSFEVFDGN